MNDNPFQSPREVSNLAGSMEPKLYRRLDALYRNGRLLPLITVLAIFVPILMLIVAPLGLVYAVQRYYLLKDLGYSLLDDPQSLGDGLARDKIDAIRRWRARFYTPSIMLLLLGAATAIVVLGSVRRLSPRTILPPVVRLFQAK